LFYENIRQAVDNINDLTKRKKETQAEYNTHLAAQVRIQKEEICKTELKNRKCKLELEVEARSFAKKKKK
jgi:hypothetical protein